MLRSKFEIQGRIRYNLRLILMLFLRYTHFTSLVTVMLSNTENVINHDLLQFSGLLSLFLCPKTGNAVNYGGGGGA